MKVINNKTLKQMKKSKNSISSWLKEYGDVEIESFIEKNLAITEKVRQNQQMER